MKRNAKPFYAIILVLSHVFSFTNTFAQEKLQSQISPLGIAWGFDYGSSGKQPVFMEHLRELGVNSTKIYLFWNQIEPEKEMFDWTAVDAFLAQVSDHDEVLIAVYSSSTWATSVATTLLPPSPAKSQQDYYEFIYRLVKRANGKVKYWQNDCEPNNPVYWAGNIVDYIEQTKVFYKAVKDADPQALVVLGGYDGLFNPPGMPEMPNQKHGLAFFGEVIDEASGFFDVLDLRLYANPYTIPERISYFQEKVGDIPIICTEYNGPGFMEFPVNRQYGALIAQWSNAYATQDTLAYFQVQDKIKGLYEQGENLPSETKLFLDGVSEEYGNLYESLQAADLVMRNVLAFSSGVKKTFYWDFWHDTQSKYDLMTVMYGKNKMADYENGEFKNYRPLASVMKRFSELMTGLDTVRKIEISENEAIQGFSMEKSNGESFLVIWEKRNAGVSENLVPKTTSIALSQQITGIQDVFGSQVRYEQIGETLTFPISSSPVFMFSK